MENLMRTLLSIFIMLTLLVSASARAEAPKPELAYQAYLEQVKTAKTLEELYPHWTINHVNEVKEEIKRTTRIGRNIEDDMAMIMSQMKARAKATNLDTLKKEITGGRAELTYQAKDPENGNPTRVVADMLFEDGSWKVIREHWYNNVKAKPEEKK